VNAGGGIASRKVGLADFDGFDAEQAVDGYGAGMGGAEVFRLGN